MDGIQLSLFGRMYPARSVAIRGTILEPCLKKSQKPIFQCLQVENGQAQEWFEGGQFAPLGDCLTLNIGEFPNEESVSTLSGVLEAIVPKKYYLSRTACEGILRRAENREKELPPILKEALEAVVNGTTLRRAQERDGVEETQVFDCRGNGDGKTSPTMTGDHNSRVTDYSAIVVQSVGFPLGFRPENTKVYAEKATTLCAGTRPGYCNGVIIRPAGFHGQNSITAAGVEYEDESVPTLTAKKNANVLYGVRGEIGDCYPKKARTLLAKHDGSFTIDGRGENITTYALQGSMIGREDKNGPQGDGVNEGVCFTLNTTDRHAVVYALDRASFNQGEHALYDFQITDSGITPTIVAKGPSAVAYEAEIDEFIEWIIRRLTPLECERLQGYPDNWTVLRKIDGMTDEEFAFWTNAYILDKQIKGVKVKKVPDRKRLMKWHNTLDVDGTRYKQCGNSLAIPCALRVVAYIADYIREEKQ